MLRHESIPNDCGIAIEYVIPQTAKRIDLLMSGFDQQNRSKLIIIELKQWKTASKTNKDPDRESASGYELSSLSMCAAAIVAS